MKVLQLRCSSSFLGAERVVIELSRHLPELGYEPIVGIPIQGNTGLPELYHQAQQQGIRAQPFRGAHQYDPRVVGLIRRFVLEHDISLIHSHGYREDLYAKLCRRHARTVATNHLWKRSTWKLRVYAAFDARWMRSLDMVVAVSQPILDEMRAAGIRRDKSYLIPNGIDVERYTNEGDRRSIRADLGVPRDALLLVTVGSLTREKGLHFAIRALSKCLEVLPNLHLVVVGSGEELGRLQQLAESCGVGSHVTFAGRRADVPAILHATDIFLLPSTAEGLPMAMLEAMAAGMAVIASDVGDVSSALGKDGGIVVPPGDVDQLAQAVRELGAATGLIDSYGRRARAIIRERYSSDRMAADYAAHYDRLLSPRATSRNQDHPPARH